MNVDPAAEAAPKTSRDVAYEAAKYVDSWEPDIQQPDHFGQMVVAAEQALRLVRADLRTVDGVALEPVRALHRLDHDAWDLVHDRCAECRHPWPCATARLVYSAEELS